MPHCTCQYCDEAIVEVMTINGHVAWVHVAPEDSEAPEACTDGWGTYWDEADPGFD